MKNKLFMFAFLMFAMAATSLKAQLNVGGGSNAPNANAVLQVTSSNKGILFPQVALTRTTLAAPLAAHVAGMMVYNTATVNDVTPGPYYNDGTKWAPFKVPPLAPCATPTVSAVAGTGSIVPGGSATFSVTASSYTSIAWVIKNSGGTTVFSGTGVTTGSQTFATADTYTVTFTATNTGGSCATTTSVASGTESVSATPCTTPSGLGVANSAPSIMPGNSSTFTLSGSNISSATWVITPSTGVSTASGTGLSTGAITFSTVGSYTVTFTASSTGSCATATATATTTESVITDRIRSALATAGCSSCGVYDASAANTWVHITASEFAALQSTSNITGSGTFMNASLNYGVTGRNTAANSTVADASSTIPAATYVIAYGIQHVNAVNGTATGCKIKIQTASGTNKGPYVDYGSVLPSTPYVANGKDYFVIKAPTVATYSGSATYLAYYSSSSAFDFFGLYDGGSLYYMDGDGYNFPSSPYGDGAVRPAQQVVGTTTKQW